MHTPAFSQLLRRPVQLLAFGFGSGLAPRAPGTFGTLAAVPLYLLLTGLSDLQYLLVLVLAGLLGVYVCHRTAVELGVHDHGGIVWDEFVGFWITMFLAPPGGWWLLAGFALFRFFDVLKPWPIRWLDRHVHGGFGIMIDDVLAGVFAWASLQLLSIWLG
jgi:phosphatidylglycerophosphatase A